MTLLDSITIGIPIQHGKTNELKLQLIIQQVKLGQSQPKTGLLILALAKFSNFNIINYKFKALWALPSSFKNGIKINFDPMCTHPKMTSAIKITIRNLRKMFLTTILN